MPAKTLTKRKMPKFKPATESIKREFDALLAALPGAERRTMFGYPSAFANGQMFLGVFGDSMMLRLSDKDRAKFLKQPGTHLFEPMPGRPMREYVQLPPAMLEDKAAIKRWAKKSLAYAQSLPPKKSKSTK